MGGLSRIWVYVAARHTSNNSERIEGVCNLLNVVQKVDWGFSLYTLRIAPADHFMSPHHLIEDVATTCSVRLPVVWFDDHWPGDWAEAFSSADSAWALVRIT